MTWYVDVIQNGNVNSCGMYNWLEDALYDVKEWIKFDEEHNERTTYYIDCDEEPNEAEKELYYKTTINTFNIYNGDEEWGRVNEDVLMSMEF